MNPFWGMWGAPLLLGVLTASGLLAALVSEAWGDVWSWLALGLPVAVMARYTWPRSRKRDPGA